MKDSLTYPKLGVVRRVHDGDSYYVKTGNTGRWIRLYLVDCPEVSSNHITKNQPYGKEAGDYVRNLLKGKEIYVDSITTDKYGRVVASVEFCQDTIWKDLATHLVEEGYAWVEPSYQPEDKQFYLFLKQKQVVARSNKIGLWKSKAMRPSTWRSKYHF